jgi:hypothetical protein
MGYVDSYIYLIVYVLLIYFKQTLIKEKESQKDEQQALTDSSSKKQDHLRKTGSSRLPVEYNLVSFLGSKLKKFWKISIHWLTCIKNLLFHPMTDEHRDLILSTQ